MKNLEIKIGKKSLWIIVFMSSLMFLAFVLADAPNPGHLEDEILVDVPANADCPSAGQTDISLKQAIDERCLMKDGEDYNPVPGGLCRICKDSCGTNGDWIQVGMIWTYGGEPEAADGNRFGEGKYRYYPSGCGGSLGGLTDHTWGTQLKFCCASAQ
tara:strand:- start:495 stop:965 length:471 start_codon:yes stop_codon:yes gene_type:complete